MLHTELPTEAARLPEARTPKLQAYLAGVALTSPDPQRLADFYVSTMGYAGQWRHGTWTGVRADRWLSVREGLGNRIDHVGFALPDQPSLHDLQRRLVAAGILWEATSADWGETPVSLADPDGNRIVFAIAPRPADAPGDAMPCRLQHVVFASEDTPDMVRFYCDVLGFAPSDYVKNQDGELTSAFLRCSSEHHSLAIFRAPQKRMDHLCYDVADWLRIRDWADAFSRHHIKLRWGPGRHGPGDNLFFFINDPDGNWLEFSAELEQIAGPRDTGLWPHEERTLNYWGSAILRS